MIGWKPKPFIFVHIPKCAGTSIEKALIPFVCRFKDFDDLSEQQRCRFWLPSKVGLQHSKLRRYEQYYELEKYFKFAFVRNPWDRAVSQIEYLSTKARAKIFDGLTFKEQLQIYCSTKKTIWGHTLGACQLDYLQTDSGHATMNFLGRFEHLSTDFRKVCALIGIQPAPELPHIFNSNRSTHYSEYYDEESVNWIRRRFARDIDFFGYNFEKPRDELSRITSAFR